MKKLLNTLYVTTPDGNADTDSQCRSNRCV